MFFTGWAHDEGARLAQPHIVCMHRYHEKRRGFVLHSLTISYFIDLLLLTANIVKMRFAGEQEEVLFSLSYDVTIYCKLVLKMRF